MKAYRITVVMSASGETRINTIHADSMRQLVGMFWAMWLWPEEPKSVTFEEVR